MHHLLERQYKKFFKDGAEVSPELQSFLKTVSTTYDNNDKDRTLLEHSFNVSSKEFSELNSKILKLVAELEAEKKSVEKKVRDRTQELLIANSRLTELDKTKTEFISVAAHQLRTPLSAIKWTMSLLLDENSSNLTPEQRSLLMKGYESNERIIRLINEMLVVTRIESGKMSYNFSFIHIEDLIENCMEEFVGQAKNRNIKLDFIEPPSKLPYINIDPDKIRTVLQNLIENAIFYTRDNGFITVSASAEGDHIRVSVKDNGIGIPEKQKVGIFNKFFRAENALKVRTDGSGLGLFVAKSIIEKHNGEIWFDSKEGEGTTFYFTVSCSDKV
ncbi:MAG: ATP-binding protein [bacterium]|nr:ATP-binding protein [bacterium]